MLLRPRLAWLRDDEAKLFHHDSPPTTMEVVDRGQRQPARGGQSLGVRYADQQRADQAQAGW